MLAPMDHTASHSFLVQREPELTEPHGSTEVRLGCFVIFMFFAVCGTTQDIFSSNVTLCQFLLCPIATVSEPCALCLVPCALSLVPCPLSLVPCPLSLVPCPLSLVILLCYLLFTYELTNVDGQSFHDSAILKNSSLCGDETREQAFILRDDHTLKPVMEKPYRSGSVAR